MDTQSLFTGPDGRIRKHIWVLAAALLLVFPFFAPEFHHFLFGEVLLFALFATAFNLLYGYNGLLSFGHALFLSFAAYTYSVFYLDVAPAIGLTGSLGSLEPLLLFIIGGIIALIATFIITVPVAWLSVRLKEIYFAIITLSFSMLFFSLAVRDVGGWSNGIDGKTVIMGSFELLGVELSMVSPSDFYFLIVIAVLPMMYLMWRIINSPFGSVSKGIRENPERAEAIGINVRRHSWYMFITSGMVSGVVGVFFVPLRTFITPSLANWTFSANPVVMTIIGGPANFLGPAIGAFVFRYARWGIDQSELLAEHWELTLGFVILFVVLFLKGGVSEIIKQAYRRINGGSSEEAPVDAAGD